MCFMNTHAMLYTDAHGVTVYRHVKMFGHKIYSRDRWLSGYEPSEWYLDEDGGLVYAPAGAPEDPPRPGRYEVVELDDPRLVGQWLGDKRVFGFR